MQPSWHGASPNMISTSEYRSILTGRADRITLSTDLLERRTVLKSLAYNRFREITHLLYDTFFVFVLLTYM